VTRSRHPDTTVAGDTLSSSSRSSFIRAPFGKPLDYRVDGKADVETHHAQIVRCVAAIVLALLAVPTVAAAQADEIQVYDGGLAAKGMVNLT
jgi:hypothetical protein